MFVGSVSKEQKPSVVPFAVIDSVVNCLSRFRRKCQDVFWESRQLLMSLSRAFVLKAFNRTTYDSDTDISDRGNIRNWMDGWIDSKPLLPCHL